MLLDTNKIKGYFWAYSKLAENHEIILWLAKLKIQTTKWARFENKYKSEDNLFIFFKIQYIFHSNYAFKLAQTFWNGEGRGPLTSKYIKANAAIAVDIGMINSCGEGKLDLEKITILFCLQISNL